jgi:hypothetical protein
MLSNNKRIRRCTGTATVLADTGAALYTVIGDVTHWRSVVNYTVLLSRSAESNQNKRVPSKNSIMCTNDSCVLYSEALNTPRSVSHKLLTPCHVCPHPLCVMADTCT